jgi:hypothetical protein
MRIVFGFRFDYPDEEEVIYGSEGGRPWGPIPSGDEIQQDEDVLGRARLGKPTQSLQGRSSSIETLPHPTALAERWKAYLGSNY